MIYRKKIAVVIPCFNVAKQVIDVIKSIGKEVDLIYCIDDKCPEKSGKLIQKKIKDKRIFVIFHKENLGVGGATISGIQKALEDGAQVIVKLDGDGQMDTSEISRLVNPIIEGVADYTKGNRFHDLESIREMPLLRLFGNSILSFFSKLSTGYWNIMDPTNGFTAIHRKVVQKLVLENISKDYFFETDMLFRLHAIGAVVLDIPVNISYSVKTSNMKIRKVMHYFFWRNFRNLFSRVLNTYFLRDFSFYTVYLILGFFSVTGGLIFGLSKWFFNMKAGITTPAGTVMVAALPVIIGAQLLINFISYDIRNVPQVPLQEKL